MRALPGAGKTSFMWSCIGDILDNVVALATDDWFMVDGKYKFDGEKLPEYHAACLKKATEAMEAGERVWVHNTFTQRWEMEPYLVAAKKLGYRVDVISLFDNGCTDEELAARCEHGVPAAAIAKMRERFEHDWKNGSPERPVWKPTVVQEHGIASMAQTIVSGTDPIHEAEEAEKNLPDIDLEVSAEHQMKKMREEKS